MPTTSPARRPSGGFEPGNSGAGSGTVTTAAPPKASGKSGSMKVKRTTSAAKVLTKSKSSGSLKKKTEAKSGRTGSTSEEVDLLAQKMNGALGEGEEGEEESERKETSIKCLWKKAIKNMKIPGAELKESVKKASSFKRRDSRHDEQDFEPEEPKEIDPVYSLLKCAADLPKAHRANKEALTSSSGSSYSQHGPHYSGHQGRPDDSLRKSTSPPPSQGLSLLVPPGCTCTNCGNRCDQNTTHSLGHDFKQFYKQTSPVKRLSSAEMGI